MFGILDLIQGKLIFAALFFLVFCAFQSKDANKYIDKVNEENSADYRVQKLPTAPFGSLIIVIVLLAIALLLPAR